MNNHLFALFLILWPLSLLAMEEHQINALNCKIDQLNKRFKPIWCKPESFPENYVLRTTQSIHVQALQIQASFPVGHTSYEKLQKLIVRSNLIHETVKLQSEQAQKS